MPGMSTRIGGGEACMTRICTGEVCVRSSSSPSPGVSCTAARRGTACRAGPSPGGRRGKLSARKLYHSVSTSGPSAMVKPRPRKISPISSITAVTGMQRADPAAARRACVRSTARRSAPRPRSASSARRAATAASARGLEGVDGRAEGAPLLGRRATPGACSAAVSAPALRPRSAISASSSAAASRVGMASMRASSASSSG